MGGTCSKHLNKLMRVGTRALQTLFVLLLALLLATSTPLDHDLSDVASLKAKVARQSSRIRELEAENALLRSQKGVLSEETMADLTLEEDVSKSNKGQCHFNALSTGTCPNHCQGKCYLKSSHFDSKCRMNAKTFAKQTSSDMVELVKNSTRPQWKLRGVVGKDPQTGHSKFGLLGTVSCPCTEKGKDLTEVDAVRSIVGQVAALGIPDVWLQWMCQKRASGGMSSQVAIWNSKVVVSAMKMLHCWKSKCAATTNQRESADAQLDELLDHRSTAATGWNCG